MKYDLEYAILESILGEPYEKSDKRIRWTPIPTYKRHYCAIHIEPPHGDIRHPKWYLLDPEETNKEGYTFEEIVTMMRNDHGWLL